MVLNSGFTFLKSLFKKNDLEKNQFFENKNEMLKYLNLQTTLSLTDQEKLTIQQLKEALKDHHLMIVISESLSSEYLKWMPFLTELSKESIFFKNMYANGRRSVEGVAAILSGIPALMEEPFLNSEFASNEFVGIGQLYKNLNYETRFYHGAKNGSMRFDSFSEASGFKEYHGLNEFRKSNFAKPEAIDPTWGVYDSEFFNYICDINKKSFEKKMDVIFTLSLHYPFNIPTFFQPTIKFDLQNSEKNKIVQSIQYYDDSLKKFFSCLQKNSDFKKMVFIILADHTGPQLETDPNDFEAKFKIPLIIYSADTNIQNLFKKSLDTNQFAQQIDLLPTLNDLFDLRLGSKNHMARSLLMRGPKTIVLYTDRHHQMVGDSIKSENHLKAFKQYFSEGMYDNRLYYK